MLRRGFLKVLIGIPLVALGVRSGQEVSPQQKTARKPKRKRGAPTWYSGMRERARQRQISLGQLMQARGAEYLRGNEMTDEVAVKAITEGIRLERQAHGLV